MVGRLENHLIGWQVRELSYWLAGYKIGRRAFLLVSIIFNLTLPYQNNFFNLTLISAGVRSHWFEQLYNLTQELGVLIMSIIALTVFLIQHLISLDY